jgi:selenocysteine-specific elongation factor
MMVGAASQSSRLIIGTAGHVDHGKTSLVHALTGVVTDRLPEEKARGISIELGFAPLTLPDGRRAAIVDVPGHEKFLRAMVAGASGVDLVLLVVAANEGVMPQTREHLDVCALLGLRRGLVALTKIDVVDPDLRALATEEVREALAGTFLDGAQIIPCSTLSGDGLDELREALAKATADLAPRESDGPARLPVDRVFAAKGFGKVVTGTVASGRFAVGDEVAVLPGGGHGRLRSIEEHGEKREHAVAGERAAFNLPGFDRRAPVRGSTIVRAGELDASTCVDAIVTWLPICPAPLPRRTNLLFHALTVQEEVAVHLLDGEPLRPGNSGPAQLHLGHAVALLPGDRFVLRGFRSLPGHGTVVGGGRVVRVAVAPRRRRDPHAADRVRGMAAATGEERVYLELAACGAAGLARAQLAGRTGFSASAVAAALKSLAKDARAVLLGEPVVHLMAANEVARLEAAILERLEQLHAGAPLAPGISREALRTGIPLVARLEPRVFVALLDRLAARRALRIDADLVCKAGFSPQRAEAARAGLIERLSVVLARGALAPPSLLDLTTELGETEAAIKEAMGILVRRGDVVRVKQDLHFDSRAVTALHERLRVFLLEKGQITPQEFKAMVGSTRKYVIPLAEHFDAEKVTFRVGDVRRLRALPVLPSVQRGSV